MSKCTPSVSIQDLLDPMCTNDWNKLIRYTKNLHKWFYIVHIDSHTETKILEHAKKLWFLSAMPETIEAFNSGRLKELNVKNDNGIIIIQGRASA